VRPRGRASKRTCVRLWAHALLGARPSLGHATWAAMVGPKGQDRDIQHNCLFTPLIYSSSAYSLTIFECVEYK